MTTITKAELTEYLFGTIGLNRREAKELIDLFFEEITQALEKSEVIKLAHLGRFYSKEKTARIGRNPRTKQEHVISARRVALFKANDNLKEKIAKYAKTHLKSD